MGIIAGIISKFAGEQSANIITSVGEVADKFITTNQEKEQFKAEISKEINRHVEAMAGNQTKDLELHFNDVASARDMNSRIQESDKASWLSKNIAYILDCLFVTTFIIMLIMIVNLAVPEGNKELFYTGFGLLGGFVGTILNFHRGTSKGSENKQKQIDKMVNKV